MGDGFSLAWKILDAKYSGVPQRRKRIYLVGDLNGGVHPKYCLSPLACSGILRRAEKHGRTLPPILRDALTKTVLHGSVLPPPNRIECINNSGNGIEAEYIVVENHPADSRIKICEDGIVQTLSARMGTGGGNVPLVLNCSISRHSQNMVGGGQRQH